MNLSVNGQSQVPPGFRFHPTEEELLHYYLRKKVASKKIDLDVIRDVDLNKLEPWDIQEKCRIGSTPQNDWYFFSHKDKKYPTGTRTNRATAAGFWKATGRDKVIYSCSKRIGMRKTLVFYKGRAPHGQKSDWIMHEYRLDDNIHDTSVCGLVVGEANSEDGWVVCRVFKKKNYHKAVESSQNTIMDTGSLLPSKDGILDRILVYMGRTSCKQENGTNSVIDQGEEDSSMQFLNNNNNNNNNLMMNSAADANFMHLPRLESPSIFNQDCSSFGASSEPSMNDMIIRGETEPSCTDPRVAGLSDWVALDRLVASQLNGQVDHDDQEEVFCFPGLDHNNEGYLTNLHPRSTLNRSHHQAAASPHHQAHQVYGGEVDFWSFARTSSSSSSDPLCHLSV